jgi:hypothetical protein
MSAQLQSREAPSPPEPRATSDEPEPGADAIDHWLRQELGRLYDAALSEPLPEELVRLVGAPRDPAPRPR